MRDLLADVLLGNFKEKPSDECGKATVPETQMAEGEIAVKNINKLNW